LNEIINIKHPGRVKFEFHSALSESKFTTLITLVGASILASSEATEICVEMVGNTTGSGRFLINSMIPSE
jgi:hypothetical protein